MKMNRFLILPLFLFCGLCLSRNAQSADADFANVVKPFLEKHCLSCHDSEKHRGGVRYDQLKAFQLQDNHLWTLAHEKLSANEMPPESRPQPSAKEKEAILSWIKQQQRAHRGESTRRLNRRELSSALQDVTGLRIDFTNSLPQDGKVNGFDTGIQGLQDTADSVAKTMQVTGRAVNGLRFLETNQGLKLLTDLVDVKDTRRAFDPWKKAGAYAKVRGTHRQGEGLYIEPKWLGERGGLTFNVPPPANRQGLLRVKIKIAAAKGDFKGIPNPHLWMQIGTNIVDYREITATLAEPIELVYEAQVEELPVEKRGINITLHNKVEIPYAIKGFKNEDKLRPGEKVPGGTGLFRPEVNRKQKLPPEKWPFPFIVLQSIEVEMNTVKRWQPDVKIEDNVDSAKRLLGLWMQRAWRQPVSEKEQQRFLDLYQRLRQQGMTFDESLRATFQSVLLSGQFRYLSSPDDDHTLASRLSFLLHGGPPDAELRQLSASGKIRQAKILDAQVDRLLQDPRSEKFFEPFVTQWLELDQPITIAMDYLKKQDFRFGRNLKDSMKQETIQYIATLFKENRPAKELVQSNWTMMNNILAHHYGYPGVRGGEFRKVELRPNDPRGGGLLGHAGIQSMLCWMGDNWVIYRGAWTLRHILDNPPPPPPLEVPELNPADNENRGKTFKELLNQHQADRRCAICHKDIDPLGFAYQNFDLSGRWRDVEYESYKRAELDGKIEWRGTGKTRPVDTVGQLPGGEKFSSFAECKGLIVKNYQDQMVRGLLKNLMLYATGRVPDVDDLAEIRAIMKQQATNGYRLRDLLKALVKSQSFLGKR